MKKKKQQQLPPPSAFADNAAAAGCLSAALRRLLCGQSSASGEVLAVAEYTHSPPPPPPGSPCGVVARLMGLDSMPPPAAAALRRCRSAGSAADGPPLERMRTSASYREAAVYLRQESEEFLVLCFSPERGKGGCLEASRSEEAEQRRGKKGRRKPCETEGAPVDCDGGGSQNSSPVSVLDPPDSHETSSSTSSMEEPCSPCSEATKPTPKKQTSRRKLSSEFDHSDVLPPRTRGCHGSQDGGREAATQHCDEEGRRRALNKTEVICPDVTGIWEPICTLVEEDLKNMPWIPRDDDSSVVTEIGLRVLDQLICEAASELDFCTAKL